MDSANGLLDVGFRGGIEDRVVVDAGRGRADVIDLENLLPQEAELGIGVGETHRSAVVREVQTTVATRLTILLDAVLQQADGVAPRGHQVDTHIAEPFVFQ